MQVEKSGKWLPFEAAGKNEPHSAAPMLWRAFSGNPRATVTMQTAHMRTTLLAFQTWVVFGQQPKRGQWPTLSHRGEIFASSSSSFPTHLDSEPGIRTHGLKKKNKKKEPKEEHKSESLFYIAVVTQTLSMSLLRSLIRMLDTILTAQVDNAKTA